MFKAVAFLVMTIVTLNGSAKALDVEHFLTADNENGDLRLVDGITNTSGRVEIYYNDIWGTICDDGFDTAEARVVCNQLGLGDTEPHVWRDNVPAGTGYILLDELECIGNETSLTECRHPPWGEHDCRHSEDAAVECDDAKYIGNENGDLRLSGGFTNTMGLVQIYYNGMWGTICDDGFYTNEARVVCNQLGLGDRRPQIWRNSGADARGYILLDDIDCVGNETLLTECSHLPWGNHNCRHKEDVVVECDGLSFADELRLVGGTERSGRLEVRYGAKWGVVTDTWFNQSAAEVACRTLGFEVNTALPTLRYGRGSGSVFLNRFECQGNESSLSECTFMGPFGLDKFCRECDHAGVICLDINETTVDEIEFRLNGGSNVSGRLELSLSGIWGTVCEDGFDNTTAQIACRTLNLPADHAVLYSFSITNLDLEPSTVWLDDVRCNGTEQSLLDCQHRDWTEHNCFHSEDVGIFCTDAADALHHHEIRLAGFNSTDRGRVEVKYYGIWGTVCDYLWREANTNVICRTLNLPYENATTTSMLEGPGPMWLEYVRCNGNETSVFDCRHARLGRGECQRIENTHAVAVICE